VIWFLRFLFTLVLGSMLGVTTWASLQVPVLQIPRSVGAHPWFIATLFDTYWAFFTFYVWLAYKEPGWLPRVLWFVAVVLLGNIAMSIYCLIQLWRLPGQARLEQLLLRDPRPVAWWVPAGLIGAIVAALSLGGVR
jgi:predicted permease